MKRKQVKIKDNNEKKSKYNKAIKVITNKGNNGITNQIYFCAKTILVKFKEPVHKKITAKTEPIDNS